MVITCILCGLELDRHDVDANLTTWGVFRAVCSDDVWEQCLIDDPTQVATI